MIQLGIKLLIKVQESQKPHQRIIQKQMKKQYLEKYIYIYIIYMYNLSRTKKENYWWSKIKVIIYNIW